LVSSLDAAQSEPMLRRECVGRGTDAGAPAGCSSGVAREGIRCPGAGSRWPLSGS